MRRKTAKAGIAAIAAGAMAMIFSADGSGAVAQVAEPGALEGPIAAPLTDEVVPEAAPEGAVAPIAPHFVSREIVQPLPEPAEPRGTLRRLVATTDVAETLSEQMQCLAGAIYFESRGEPLSGQLAVAQVIINRAESERFPSSYCGVVHQRGQFSFVRNGHMPAIRTSSPAWQRARAIARIAHEGLWDSEAGDALYFHADYARPRWARGKLARATISGHTFYR